MAGSTKRKTPGAAVMGRPRKLRITSKGSPVFGPPATTEHRLQSSDDGDTEYRPSPATTKRELLTSHAASSMKAERVTRSKTRMSPQPAPVSPGDQSAPTSQQEAPSPQASPKNNTTKVSRTISIFESGDRSQGIQLGDIENMQATLATIIKYFKHWCEDARTEGPPSIFHDLRVIHQTTEGLRAGDVPKDLDVRYRDWCERFATIWAGPAMTVWQTRFGFLKAEIEKLHHIDLSLEAAFHELAVDAGILAPSVLQYVVNDSQRHYVPKFVENDDMEEVMQQLRQLHWTFQNNAYIDEIPQLWLCLSTSILKVFQQLQDRSIEICVKENTVDAHFFNEQRIQRFNSHAPFEDITHPRAVENIVADYCKHIAKCLESSKAEYRTLRTHKADFANNDCLRNLKKFVGSATLAPTTFPCLNMAALRLNMLLKGYATIRRWGESEDGKLVSWMIIKKTCKGEKRTPLDHITDSRESLKNTLTLRSESSNSAGNTTEASADVIPLQEECRRIVSAFDYVHYPFAETRALEVAQSRQIARDMSDSGIVSDGPRVADVIHLPPRHARASVRLTPYLSRKGKSSIYMKRRAHANGLGWGPHNAVTAIWRLVFRRDRRRLPIATSRTPVTPRKKQSRLPGHVLRAIRDNRARVHKIPQLVGGGRSPNAASELTPEFAVEATAAAIPADIAEPSTGPENGPGGDEPATELEATTTSRVGDTSDTSSLGETERAPLKEIVGTGETATQDTDHNGNHSPDGDATGDIDAESQEPLHHATLAAAAAPAFAIFRDRSAKSTSEETSDKDNNTHSPFGSAFHDGVDPDEAISSVEGGFSPLIASSGVGSSSHPLHSGDVPRTPPGPCHPCPQYPGEYHHNCTSGTCGYSPFLAPSGSKTPSSRGAENDSNQENRTPEGTPVVHEDPTPTAADYELLFADEMRTELGSRGVGTDQSRGLTRAQLIARLLSEDAAGNIGSGNSRGYRVCTGMHDAKRREKGWTYKKWLGDAS